MILEWHRAFAADPRFELTKLGWDAEAGHPDSLAFVFTWALGTASFEVEHGYKYYTMAVIVKDVPYCVVGARLPDDAPPDAFVSEVVRVIAQRSVSVNTMDYKQYGDFWWRLKDRGAWRMWWHAVISRAMRALVEDWQAIRRFAAGEP